MAGLWGFTWMDWIEARPVPLACGPLSPRRDHGLPVPSCLFHGHNCCRFNNMLCNSAQTRRGCKESNKEYLRVSFGYTLITIWEWTRAPGNTMTLLRQRPLGIWMPSTSHTRGWEPAPHAREWPAVSPVGHMQGPFLRPGPGRYPHLPKTAKDAILDRPPIFKTAMVSSHDTGPHMVQNCEAISMVTWQRLALIISYLVHQVVIPTYLLRSYLLRCLTEICLHILLQYDKHHCFQSLVKDSTQNQWDAQQDTSWALAGESAKLIMTSIDGKCFEIKMHFPQTYLMPTSVVGALAWLPLRISYFLPESTRSVAWLPCGDPCFTWSHPSVIWHRHHTDYMPTTAVGAWSVYHRVPLVSILCCHWLGTNTPNSAWPPLQPWHWPGSQEDPLD